MTSQNSSQNKLQNVETIIGTLKYHKLMHNSFDDILSATPNYKHLFNYGGQRN